MVKWELSSCNQALIGMPNPSEILRLVVRLWEPVFATQINALLSQSIFHCVKNAA